MKESFLKRQVKKDAWYLPGISIVFIIIVAERCFAQLLKNLLDWIITEIEEMKTDWRNLPDSNSCVFALNKKAFSFI
jgi:hypothetical protein